MVAIVTDLITASRLADAAARADVPFIRLDDPSDLPWPETVRLLLVDWGARDSRWATVLRAWLDSARDNARPTAILFGPHTDLEAHAAAKAAGLGPMRARSALFASLADLLAR